MDRVLFIYAMSALIYFTQGTGSLVGQPLYYYLKETLHIGVGTIMMLSSITSIPWMIKPLYGLLCDNVPILGYRRKGYIILSALLTVVTALVLGFAVTLPLTLFFAVMTIDSLGGAVKDVAIDGMMVEEGKKTNLTGKIQAIQWGSLTIAQILTGVAGGYISEHFDYHIAFRIVAVFPALIALLAFNYQEEAPKRKSKAPLWPKYKALLKNKQFLLSTAFLFCLWFSPSIGTPITAKMRDVLHMSKMSIGYLGSVGSACALLGSFLYYRFSKGLNMKRWLYIGVLFSAVSTLAYLWLTPTLVWAYAIGFGISGMFVHLIVMDFMARTCPEGTEATTFALICSVVNFSGSMSNLAGGKLYDLFGYNGLIIISTVFTLLCLFLIPPLKIEGETNVLQP